MFTILRKEISGNLNSMLAYISTGVFLLVTALVLWIYPDSSVLEFGYASMQSFFDTAPWIFLLLVPAICMRLFAEEKKSGTLELLITRPLSDWQIILGKYFSALVLILFALLPTLLYVYSVYELADPIGNIDLGAIAGSYIGLFLLGAAFAAVGIFASAITSNQVIAFLISVLCCFFFYSGFDSLSHLPVFSSMDSLQFFGIQAHYASISRGVLDSRDLFYFFSFCLIFLALTKTNLESRKW